MPVAVGLDLHIVSWLFTYTGFGSLFSELQNFQVYLLHSFLFGFVWCSIFDISLDLIFAVFSGFGGPDFVIFLENYYVACCFV